MRKSATSLAMALLAVVAFAAPANGQNFSPWSEAVIVGPPISMEFGASNPFIAKNGLDLYFASNRPGGEGRIDLYVSHRDSVEDPWEEPINLGPEINTSTSDEAFPFVTIDGHWLYFVSGRPGGCGARDLWVARRRNKRDDRGWETPKNLGCLLNSPNGEISPFIFEDQATGQTWLYFSSNRPGGAGGWDIYVSPMVGEDKETFGPPLPVWELNTPEFDLWAFARRKDGLEIIFVSTRAGGFGLQDFWGSTRPDTLFPWSPPVNLGPLVNSAGNEGGPSISWDGTTLYFSSDRQGRSDVYVASRTKLPE